MLEVQKFLKDRNHLDTDTLLGVLNTEYGIKNLVHEDGRVILNYNQIESPKNHPIVRECRGLVLNYKQNWDLVARAFPRFFNAGELGGSALGSFKWDDCCIQAKEDGSLILCYNWNGDWHINTRGSFGNGSVNGHEITWRQLFEKARVFDYKELSKDTTYVFELCSRYNKVVRDYQTPKTFLLSAFNGEEEVSYYSLYNDFQHAGPIVDRAAQFKNIDEIVQYLSVRCHDDPTFEGYVLRDYRGMRVKIKSTKYVELHRLCNNGYLSRPKDAASFIFDGESEEIAAYFPEMRDVFNQVRKILEDEKKLLKSIIPHKEVSQKEFALEILSHEYVRCQFVLFEMRKSGCSFEDAWLSCKNKIISKLFAY